MGADSASELLIKYNQKKFEQFTRNNDKEVSLLSISSVVSEYKKVCLPLPKGNHVRFISKDDEPHSLFWQTTPEKLKEAVRWGIVRTESVTAKTISALGRYRVKAHERVAKGVVSNTQGIKLRLLDLYQDRFEALQELELMVNKQNSAEDYEKAIGRYIKQLESFSSELESRFHLSALAQVDDDALEQIKDDLGQDIARAKDYLEFINGQQCLRSVNRAAGSDSVLVFIKEQMSYNLYELQGINQDLTYSSSRQFAFTRGEFNDCIEDARREIDDYKADLRNAQTPSHQGLYDSGKHQQSSYDFQLENLSPAREREVLLAVSFIEGWDRVNNIDSDEPTVSNKSGTEPLDIITATNWGAHRNIIAVFKAIAYFLFNMVKSIFVATKPWEEEAWSNNENEDFHLVAKSLREHARANEPLWYKPVRFFKTFWHGALDLFQGIGDFSSELVFEMPIEIYGDYIVSKELPPPDKLIGKVEEVLSKIRTTEEERLNALLSTLNYELKLSEAKATPARPDYHLSDEEAMAILNAIVRGFYGFSSIFTQGIYAKDPVGGLAFSFVYFFCFAIPYDPVGVAKITGEGFVKWFNALSYAMGSSQFAAAVAGSSTLAQLAASSVDLISHGPNSGVAKLTMQILEDPLTTAAYLAAAYTVGHVLVEGIAGYPIPWLSNVLREDMGTVPELNYPLLGGKLALLLYESFETHETHPHHFPKLKYNQQELEKAIPKFEESKETIDRFRMALWLAKNAEDLPKLRSGLLFELGRQIDNLFPPAEAKSLKKILYPEKQRSIAYQLFAVPLRYVLVIFRLAVSPFISLFAWLIGNPYPLQPMVQAGTVLVEAIAKDMSRLAVAINDLLHAIYNSVACHIKALVFTVSMFIGRCAGLFNLHPGHAMHKAFASVHVFCDQVGAFFYPARLIKNTIYANPVHTVKESELSYTKLMTRLNAETREDLSGQKEVQHHSSPVDRGGKVRRKSDRVEFAETSCTI